MAVQSQLNDRSFDTTAFAAAVASVEENSVTVLSPELLLKGEYLQQGDDLIIRGELGEEILVEGYFSGESSPVLETLAGAVLHPDTVQKLLINTDSVEVAGPAGSMAIPGLLGDPIGTLDEMGGEVTAKGADGVLRVLKEGDAIYQNDLIETVGRSYANLRMEDDTSFQLGKETRAIIENYSFTPGVESGQFEATVVSGFFRYASGKLGGLDKGTHTTIKTPTAQIGVRGSEMEGVVEADGSSTFVHQEGILDVSDANGRGTVTLDEPGMATAVSISPGAPEPAFDAPDELKARFEEALPPVPDYVIEANEEQQAEALPEVPLEGDLEETQEEIEEFELATATIDREVDAEAGTIEGVRVNLKPIATADTFELTEDIPDHPQGFTGNLAANDELGDGTHTWSLLSGPMDGSTLTLNTNGTFTYTPKKDYDGSDSFTYVVRDADGDESTATVTINLSPVNDMPTIGAPGTLIFTEGESLTGDIILTDVDGGNLTGATISINNLAAGDQLTFTSMNFEGTGHQIEVSTESSDGVLILTGTATAEEYEAALKSVVYNNTEGDALSAGASRSVSWFVSAGADHSETFTKDVAIEDVNNNPDVGAASADKVTFIEGAGASTGTTQKLFSGVTIDPVESNQTITQIVLKVENILDPAYEFLQLGGNSFDIAQSIVQGGDITSGLAQVEVNYDPTSKTSTITLNGDWDNVVGSPKNVDDFVQSIGYFNNSQDPTGGTDPSKQRIVRLLSVSDSEDPPGVTYLDGENKNTTVTVATTVNVRGMNDLPEANDDEVAEMAYEGGTSISGNLLINDTDYEDTLSIAGGVKGAVTIDQITSATAITEDVTISGDYGTLTLSADGNYTYTPSEDVAGFAGGDEVQELFTYKISDGKGGYDIAQLSIQITGTNAVPTLSATTRATQVQEVTVAGSESTDVSLSRTKLFSEVSATIGEADTGQTIQKITLTVSNVAESISGNDRLYITDPVSSTVGPINLFQNYSNSSGGVKFTVSRDSLDPNTAEVVLEAVDSGGWSTAQIKSLIESLEYQYTGDVSPNDPIATREVTLTAIEDSAADNNLNSDISIQSTVRILPNADVDFGVSVNEGGASSSKQVYYRYEESADDTLLAGASAFTVAVSFIGSNIAGGTLLSYGGKDATAGELDIILDPATYSVRLQHDGVEMVVFDTDADVFDGDLHNIILSWNEAGETAGKSQFSLTLDPDGTNRTVTEEYTPNEGDFTGAGVFSLGTWGDANLAEGVSEGSYFDVKIEAEHGGSTKSAHWEMNGEGTSFDSNGYQLEVVAVDASLPDAATNSLLIKEDVDLSTLLDTGVLLDLSKNTIEHLDLRASGNQVVTLDVSDVLSFAGNANQDALYIFAEGGDTVKIEANSVTPTEVKDDKDVSYNLYTVSDSNGTVDLYITVIDPGPDEPDVTVEFL